MFSSLTNRIFFASAALAILCIGVAIYVVNERVTTSAEEEMGLDLKQTAAVVDREREKLASFKATVEKLSTNLAQLS